MHNTTPKKYIDIDKVIKDKNAEWLPWFVKRYLKRIIHEREFNAMLPRINSYYKADFARAAMDDMGIKMRFKGLENIPTDHSIIVSANHPLGGVDGLALIVAVGEVREDIRFLVNDVLLNVENLKGLFVPVNKFGSNPREASKIIEETYAQDVAILNFPSGLVSRKQKHGIADLEWKKSFIARSIKYQKDVLPAHISGRNSPRFYRISRLRQMLGIQSNIEMMFLADEMLRQSGKTITVTFGQPIPWQTFDKSKTHSEWANMVKERVYAMAEKNAP